MDKLDQINFNITNFFQDIVAFVEKVWEFVKNFFGDDAKQPLVEDETTA